MIPCTNSPPSKILHTSENCSDSCKTKPSLYSPVNLIETPKKTNDASININEIH